MATKTVYVQYNNNWGGENFYRQEVYTPPAAPKKYYSTSTSTSSTSRSSGGGGGGGGSDGGEECSLFGCLITIYGILCAACIVLFILIPNYPDSIPIGYIAIPGAVFGILTLIAFYGIWYRCCYCECDCCCGRRGFSRV